MEFMFYDPWSDLCKVRSQLKRLQDEIYDPWYDDEEEQEEEEEGTEAPEQKKQKKAIEAKKDGGDDDKAKTVVPIAMDTKKKSSGPLAVMKRKDIWWPAVDLKETKEGYELHAELPGVKKEDVHIELHGQGANKRLVVSGKKAAEEKKEGEHWHRVERSFGEFKRAFTVPADTMPGDIKAKFEDGMLRVNFPKPKPTEPVKIAIN